MNGSDGLESTQGEMLIVEDDPVLARTLQRSFERRGYRVHHATHLAAAQAILDQHDLSHAVVDLKLANGDSGLACVKALHSHNESIQIVVLTGYASINTAVEAIKLGARHYLVKPSNSDDIEAAFERGVGDDTVELSNRTTSIKTLEWEKIHEVLAACDFNISEAARQLGMHRRTLARKLEKLQIR